MAGTITHFYFANDVMKKVEKKRKIIYDVDFLNVFSQSMDSFNFYNIYFPIKKDSVIKRKFAGVFHHTKSNEFFSFLIHYIKDNNLTDNIEVMTFLYGLITHYVLDSSIHPYVEYKCGRLNVKDKNTYRYNAKHHEMETFIDIYMLEKHGIKAKKFKVHKEIFKVNKFNIELKNTMNKVFFNIFEFKNFDKHYLKSIQDMKNTFRVLRYDPYGYKKYFYALFDSLSGKKILNSKFLSYSFIPKQASRYLNDNHAIWHYPYDISREYTYSFDELYHIAIDRCIDLIIDVIDYLYKNKKCDFDTLFCLSYVSGLNWNIPEVNAKYEF